MLNRIYSVCINIYVLYILKYIKLEIVIIFSQ